MWTSTTQAAICLQRDGWTRISSESWVKVAGSRMLRCAVVRRQSPSGRVVWYTPELEECEVVDCPTVLTGGRS